MKNADRIETDREDVADALDLGAASELTLTGGNFAREPSGEYLFFKD